MPTPLHSSSWTLFAGFPPPVPPATPESSGSEFQVRKYAPRKRRGFDWESFASLVGVLVLLGVGGLLVGMFVNQSTLDLLIGPKKQEPQVVEQPQPLQVPVGGGSESKTPPSKAQAPGRAAVADEHLRNSLESARKGHFNEADLSAEKALKANPDDPRAEGMRLVIAYLRQYSGLADQALDSLNPNDLEIDLGGRNGKAAFVERDGDVLTLRVKGKNEKFTIKDINGMPGARFRITKAFLERNGSPANHLILGAHIFITQQDERGRVDPMRSRNLAEAQWRKAESLDDATCAEHASLMLNVLNIK